MLHEAKSGSRSRAVHIFSLLSRSGGVVSAMLQPLCPRDRTPIPIIEDAVSSAAPVWTCLQKREFSTPRGLDPGPSSP